MAVLGDILENYGKEIVASLQSKMKEKKLIASGLLYQSIKYSVKIFGKDYVLHIGFDPEYDIVASTMNDGGKWKQGKGNMPPIEPIMKWMRAKGIKASMSTKRKGLIKSLKNKTVKKGFRQASQEKLQRGMAFGIAKNIQKNGVIERFGYKGSRFWDEVVNEDLKRDLKKDIVKAIKRDIVIEFGDLKKEIKSHGG